MNAYSRFLKTLILAALFAGAGFYAGDRWGFELFQEEKQLNVQEVEASIQEGFGVGQVVSVAGRIRQVNSDGSFTFGDQVSAAKLHLDQQYLDRRIVVDPGHTLLVREEVPQGPHFAIGFDALRPGQFITAYLAVANETAPNAVPREIVLYEFRQIDESVITPTRP